MLIYITAKSQVDMDSQESVGDGSICYAASSQQHLTHSEEDAPVKELQCLDPGLQNESQAAEPNPTCNLELSPVESSRDTAGLQVLKEYHSKMMADKLLNVRSERAQH